MIISAVVGGFLSVSSWGAVADLALLWTWLSFSWCAISQARLDAGVPCLPFKIESDKPTEEEKPVEEPVKETK